ncbi:uncharacterized protein N7484_000228 [Penicillium longicatenatum]|uniref:uncharacterized protein n=1 Tax=Penicillium longicatenatum TaxID=1561947 RepID=UPI002548BFA2|nr:uncharacterized protein N7484_000228 [Penicillium longicatenatum]KAJ5660856.1 hypothetical protein N7484_000228 [Penicillium longicatenatum]
MRICVFQSCFEELQASVGESESQQLCMNPGVFTTQHHVSHKTIHKKTAKQQIDEAVAEGYDFYLNFLWGTHEDSLAGIDAIRYFESLNLPHAGVQSSERSQSKWDFFAEAKRAGSPLIPGTECFPLFVKPASSYGSMFIDEHSLCRDEAELESCIHRLNTLMRPVRIQRALALGHQDGEQYANACEAAGRESTDIVVQEFIAGEEYSVVVIAMGESPIPLIPQRAKYKQVGDNARILTLELKFDAESGYELMSEDEDPALWKHLQETAVEAFTTKKMYTNGMGCDVDMRIGQDGRAYVIEVDPLPVFFYPPGSQLEDTDVKYGFPGAYRAVINTYITNYFLKNPGVRGARFAELASLFDEMPMTSCAPDQTTEITALSSFKGTALDLGCGTGSLGRALKSNPRNRITHLVGVDISKKMLGICHQEGGYCDLIHDRMESFLATRTETVDHIFCASALEFLPMEELDFVLARCFQLATRSITVVIENPKSSQKYNSAPWNGVQKYTMDHSESIRTFQIQRSWSMRSSVTDKSHLVFHFQRDQDS